MERSHGIALELDINVTMLVHDAVTGDLVHEESGHNLFVTKGLSALADVFAGSGVYASNGNVTHMGVGTNSTVAVPAQLALVAEVFRGALTKVTRSAQSVGAELFLTSTQGNGNTLVEAGLFNGDIGMSSPRDAMFARFVHAPVVKTSGVTITYLWSIGFAAV